MVNKLKKSEVNIMQNEQALLQGDLADKLKVRASTIKYYTQLGLLPYECKGANYRRYYKVSEVKPILADIDKLKRKGYKMLDIVKLYASQGKLADDIDLTLLNLGKKQREVKQNG